MAPLACRLSMMGCLLAGVGATATDAQSLLDRSPNMSGAWVGLPGTLHFNFLHRFTQVSAPERKVTSSPTFLVAGGLPWRTLVGFSYATNSDVAPRYPNEWELFGRFAPIAQDAGRPVDAGVQLGYNVAAQSVDGELALGRRIGPVGVHGAARFLSSAFGRDTARIALAGGATLRLGRHVALAGDYAVLLDAPASYDNAWSAALQLAIPYTPHTLSLHASNTNTATLHGASASRAGQRRYGFEFTIPVTLRRYFPRAAPPLVAADTGAEAASGAAADAGSQLAPPSRRDTITTPPDAVPTPRDTARNPPDSARLRRDTLAIPRDTVATRHDSVRVVRDTIDAQARRPTAVAPVRPSTRAVVRAGMRQLAYLPARIEIATGTTVEWTNQDVVTHTVTADDNRWDSGLIDPGRTWRRRFDRPGTYAFHCTPHPFMTGVIVVR